MKMMPVLATCALLGFSLTGCGGGYESESTDATPKTATSTPSLTAPPIALAAFQNEILEVGCGKCIYEMEGVERCETAIVVAGKPFLITGQGADAHEHGLCGSSKEAIVTATPEGDHFQVTSLEIQD
jgi:hypothetical protein